MGILPPYFFYIIRIQLSLQVWEVLIRIGGVEWNALHSVHCS
jgi:hypothetical protein